jgi:hypothetical protein
VDGTAFEELDDLDDDGFLDVAFSDDAAALPNNASRLNKAFFLYPLIINTVNHLFF